MMNGCNNNNALRNNDSPPNDDDRPRFAVIRLKAESNLLGLFQLLLCNGFGEVAFVKNLNDANFGGNNNKETISTCSASAMSQMTCATSTTVAADECGVQDNVVVAANNFFGGKRPSELYYNKIKQHQHQHPIPLPIPETSSRLIDHPRHHHQQRQHQSSSAIAPVQNYLFVEQQQQLQLQQSCAKATQKLQQSQQQQQYDRGGYLRNEDHASSSTSNRSINNNNSHTLAAATSEEMQQISSPILPMSTLSCPLPLPVDTTKLGSNCIPTPAITTVADSSSTKKLQPAVIPRSTAVAASASTTTTTAMTTRSDKENPAATPQQSPSRHHHGPPPPGPQFSSTQPVAQRAVTKEGPPQQQLFVSCHMCNSKIMATRFSNLTNHVRRHAPVKQFQCCYCDYAHNEIAKVRLHMANNHADKKSRPINNINSEMQDTWRRLMRECFPERSKRQRQPQPPKQQQQEQQHQHQHQLQPRPSQPSVPTATAIISHGTHITPSNSVKISRKTELDSSSKQQQQNKQQPPVKVESIASAISDLFPLQSEDFEDDWNLLENDDQIVDDEDGNDNEGDEDFASGGGGGGIGSKEEGGGGQRFARCDQCYAYVNVNMKESHVRTCHLNNLPSASFVCSLCGLENTDRNEVDAHIRLEHSDNPDAQVINADLAAYVDQMIDEYFPLHALEYTTNFDTIASTAATTTEETNIFDQFTTTGTRSTAIFGGDSILECDDQKLNFYHQDKSTTKARKCRVCRRSVGGDDADRMKHARRHVKMSAVYFECPICVNYRSNVNDRVRRHLADKHGVFDCENVPRIVWKEWIYVVGFRNAISQAMKRCFGGGRKKSLYNRKYAWKKCVYDVRSIQK